MLRDAAACLLALLMPVLAVPVAEAAALDATERRIVQAVDARQAQSLELLAEVVDIPSATENHDGVRRVGEVFARELAGLGFEIRWVDQRVEVGRAGHLVAVRRGTQGQRLLLIGHLDTVLEGEPYRREGDRAYGSGIADMKGGDVIVVEALRALHAAGALQDRQVIVVFTGDEEDPGQPTTIAREALVAAGEQSDVALGFEGAVDGVAVTGRRGIGTWRLQVSARQAHSSGIFGDDSGYGAIFETARILDRLRDDLREPNLTFNPAVILGGTNVAYDDAAKGGTAAGKTNVIPRAAEVTGDLRFLTDAQYRSATTRMAAVVAEHLPQTSANIRFELEYPAMAPTDRNREVLAVLDGVSRDLGNGPVTAQDPASRGAGDISFVCTGRLACLDGLGALGERAHAPGEYVAIDAIAVQTRRAALLFHRLTR